MNLDIKVVNPTSRSTEISLTCPAQGFPVPITRFVAFVDDVFIAIASIILLESGSYF